MVFKLCILLSKFKIKYTISYRVECIFTHNQYFMACFILTSYHPTTPPKKPPKIIIKNQTNNSWVYRSFPMNIHLHTTNTLYPILRTPNKKQKQKQKQRVYKSFSRIIHVYTTNTLKPILFPLTPPKKKKQKQKQTK